MGEMPSNRGEISLKTQSNTPCLPSDEIYCNPSRFGGLCRPSLRENVSNLILIYPPFASRVYSKMNEGGYAYIRDVQKRLSSCLPNVKFYDFLDPTTINGSSDCEFIDGFHGGDVLYARLLKSISTDNARLRALLSSDFLDRFILENSGFAGGVTRKRLLNGVEVDFNRLGCKK
jgi:hypothetical protein